MEWATTLSFGVLVTAAICIIGVFELHDKFSLDGNLFALWTQLNYGLFVIYFAHTTSVTFEHSTTNYDFFTDQFISDQSILVGDSSFRRWLHKFSSEDFYISLIFNENSVLLNVVFVPEEKIIFERMFDRSDQTLVRSFYNFDHRVVHQIISFAILSLNVATSSWRRNAFVDIRNFYIIDFTLLVQDFQVIFMDLQYQATMFRAMIIY